jgi:hypothetical protein
MATLFIVKIDEKTPTVGVRKRSNKVIAEGFDLAS